MDIRITNNTYTSLLTDGHVFTHYWIDTPALVLNEPLNTIANNHNVTSDVAAVA